jgi:hypothetical protein
MHRFASWHHDSERSTFRAAAIGERQAESTVESDGHLASRGKEKVTTRRRMRSKWALGKRLESHPTSFPAPWTEQLAERDAQRVASNTQNVLHLSCGPSARARRRLRRQLKMFVGPAGSQPPLPFGPYLCQSIATMQRHERSNRKNTREDEAPWR